MHRLITLLLLVFLSACIASPKTLQSDSLVIETATLVANQDGVHYLVIASFEEGIPDNTQAVVIYQDLSKPSTTQELALGSMSDARRLTFKSRATKAVMKQDEYQIQLLLFNNESKAKLIARRQLTLPLDVSDRVANILGITWL